jgi:general secretion pathway protein L
MADPLRRWRTEAAVFARSFWDWWRGELVALVPPVLRRALAAWGKRPVLIIGDSTAALGYETGGSCEVVGPIDLSVEQPAQVSTLLSLKSFQPGQPVAARMRLDPALALHLPMSLPLAAFANLSQVIEFEFERFSPFKRDSVYFRHQVTTRDVENARLDVELTVLRRDVVDDLLWRARRNGLRILGIDVGGRPLPLPADAATVGHESLRQRFTVLATRVFVGLAALMMTGLVVIPYLQNSAVISELADEVAQARREADASAKLQDAIDGEVHDQSFVIDRKKGSATVSELLASLTHILPDDAWLTELGIDGNGVQLSGYAQSATAVLGLLDQSPILANAAFRSSVTQDAQLGRERFDISAQIRRKTQP